MGIQRKIRNAHLRGRKSCASSCPPGALGRAQHRLLALRETLNDNMREIYFRLAGRLRSR